MFNKQQTDPLADFVLRNVEVRYKSSNNSIKFILYGTLLYADKYDETSPTEYLIEFDEDDFLMFEPQNVERVEDSNIPVIYLIDKRK